MISMAAIPQFALPSAIPPFRHFAIPPFRHSAIPPFRHSAIPPFRHSAILPFRGRNPTKPRKGSMFCGKNSDIVLCITDTIRVHWMPA